MSRGEREQSWRKFTSGLLAKRAAIVERPALLRQPRALPGDPIRLARCERLRLAARAAAWNRHTHAAIRIDANDVSSGAAVTNEICGFSGISGFERKGQLHPMRE